MRKGALFLAILLAASAPSMAFAKHKHMKKHAEPLVAELNPGVRLVGEGIKQIFVPLQSMAAQSAAHH